jgi:hypothetical protein
MMRVISVVSTSGEEMPWPGRSGLMIGKDPVSLEENVLIRQSIAAGELVEVTKENEGVNDDIVQGN